jgi:hypothetical protein
MKKIFYFLFLILIELNNSFCSSQTKPIRILVITGGHEYNIEKFNQMLASLGDDIKFQVAELPAAYDMFLPENRNKYFHKPTILNGIEYPASSYIHDLHFKVSICNHDNPVTIGLSDFEIFDETYKGFYVEEGVTPLLTTDEPSSTPIIGWSKMYGKAHIVTLQSGHDTPTFENPNYRKLLRQAIKWVYTNGQ